MTSVADKAKNVSQPKDHKLIVEKDVAIPMRDGAVIYADVFRPDTTEPVPIIMNIGVYMKDKLWVPPEDLEEKPNPYMNWESGNPLWWCPRNYAIVRVVPRVDRGEQINVGVIVSCADTNFLDARIELDDALLLALDPTIDLATVKANLSVIPAVCRGGADAGPIGQLDQRARFRWLVAPRSTIIQPSPVHTGRTSDPARCLEQLMTRIVRRTASSS